MPPGLIHSGGMLGQRVEMEMWMKSISRRELLHLTFTGGAACLAAACSPAAATPAGEQPADQAPTTAPAAAGEPTAAPAPPALPDEQRALKRVVSVEQVARLTGESSINATHEKWGVYGTDLGSMFDKGDKVYMAFGDTFGCCIPGTGGPGTATDWRYNVMAVTSDRDPSDGLTFDEMITDRPGHAKQIVTRGRFDKTVIPTNGVAVGERMFLHYMAVLAWGDPGKWVLNESGIAYSDDDGQTWEKDPAVKWSGDSNFGQVAFVKHEGYVYLFGIPGGRFGGVKLARVPQEAMLDLSAYQYYNSYDPASPSWSPDEAEAALIVPPAVGELSVMWNDYLERWIMTYLDESRQGIVIREAPELWGPWSHALPLVSGQQYPGLYGPFMHPWYVEEGGQVIYFTMSLWGPYSVYWMRARLEKV